jgi:Zn-dependent alcohol dehydrogenase
LYLYLLSDAHSCSLSTAKKFGVTEFVNPKDYKKPVQEVSEIVDHVLRNKRVWTSQVCSKFDSMSLGDS